MSGIRDILSAPGRKWAGAAPASEFEVKALEKVAGFQLPSDYLELLSCYNGGEGELAIPPFWFQLFDTRFAASLATDGFYRAEFPEFFFFGSNGGLESLAFDMRAKDKCPIVAVDCIAGLESAMEISADIRRFIEAIGLPNKTMEPTR